MLTLTNTAIEIISDLTSRPGTPETTGVRISPRTVEDGATGFQLTVAAGPATGDEVVESEGARVYLPPAVAEALTDQTLDAAVQGEGEVDFLITPTPTTPPAQ
jgi:Fe-S cluster assembly iron-binding protein IscA